MTNVATGTPSRRARARRGEGDKLRLEILEAAEALLLEAGSSDGVSMRALAEAVGVTPPAIYRHFADKDELFFELCNQRFAMFRDYIGAAETDTDDPVEALRDMGHRYLRFALEYPGHYRVLFMSGTPIPEDVPIEELNGMQAFGLLVEMVQHCVDARRFRKVDAFVASIGVWTALHGLVSIRISSDNFPWPDWDTVVDHVLDAQIRGLLAPGRGTTC